MSHYYYENAFDFIDNTGTLGYSIEQDKTLTSDSLGVVAGADDYIIEVHYFLRYCLKALLLLPTIFVDEQLLP